MDSCLSMNLCFVKQGLTQYLEEVDAPYSRVEDLTHLLTHFENQVMESDKIEKPMNAPFQLLHGI